MNQDHFFTTWATELARPDWADEPEPVGQLPDTLAAPAVATAVTAVGQRPDTVSTTDAEAEDADREDGCATPAWCPYLRAASEEMRNLVSRVQQHLLRAEHRQRARRPGDLEVFNLTVEALVCCAVRQMLRGAGPIRVGADNNKLRVRNQYKSPLESTQLPTILALMVQEEFLYMHAAAERPRTHGASLHSPGRQAEYSMGHRLAALAGDALHSDVLRTHGDEVILLKGRKDDHKAPELVEYQRAPAIVSQYREDVRALNEFRQRANIRWVGDPKLADVNNRHTVRRFTRGRWDCGGRHWSGFWQSLPKSLRLNLLRIDDEPVIGVDFAATVPTLAYARAGLPLPEGDLYEFTLVDREGREVPTTRKVRKRLFNALINGAKDWPRGLREQYRRRVSWRWVVDALNKAHPALAGTFAADIGQELAFMESAIMAAVLKELRLRGVVALDIHDCVVVKQSAADVATEVMLAQFQRVAGVPAKVNLERPEDYPMRATAAAHAATLVDAANL